MKCNKCENQGIINHANGKEFWYCKTCKDEIVEALVEMPVPIYSNSYCIQFGLSTPAELPGALLFSDLKRYCDDQPPEFWESLLTPKTSLPPARLYREVREQQPKTGLETDVDMRLSSNMSSIEECLMDASIKCARRYGDCLELCFISYDNYGELLNSLGSMVQYVEVQSDDDKISLSGVRFRGVNSYFIVCPSTECSEDTIKIRFKSP